MPSDQSSKLQTRKCRYCGKTHQPTFHRYIGKRNPFQRTEKMEAMPTDALRRYFTWFRKWLIQSDLVILQRLGAI